jgi:hypothetical protein
MRRVFTVLTAAFVALTFSSMVFAQAAEKTAVKTTEKAVAKTETAAKTTEKAVAKTETAAKTTEKAAAKAAPLTTSGKVAKIDEATKAFTVTTKDGDKEFTLAADAKITAGAKEAKAADLAGKNVKVTYASVDGKNVASKVTVASEPKPAAEKAEPKKEEKKAEKPAEKK